MTTLKGPAWSGMTWTATGKAKGRTSNLAFVGPRRLMATPKSGTCCMGPWWVEGPRTNQINRKPLCPLQQRWWFSIAMASKPRARSARSSDWWAQRETMWIAARRQWRSCTTRRPWGRGRSEFALPVAILATLRCASTRDTAWFLTWPRRRNGLCTRGTTLATWWALWKRCLRRISGKPQGRWKRSSWVLPPWSSPPPKKWVPCPWYFCFGIGHGGTFPTVFSFGCLVSVGTG